MYREDPKGRCNYCNVYAGRDKVKACGRCHLVRYCSKTCQVAAWRTHKQRCASTLRENLAENPVAYARNAAMSKWINHFRQRLYDGALCAMDLANHPEDRLATHSLVVELERGRPNQNPSLQLRGGVVMPREDTLTRLRAINDLTDGMVALITEQRGNDTVQIVVIYEDMVRILWFSLRDGGASLRQRDPELSRAVAQAWEHCLFKEIDTDQAPSSSSSLHGSEACPEPDLLLPSVTE